MRTVASLSPTALRRLAADPAELRCPIISTARLRTLAFLWASMPWMAASASLPGKLLRQVRAAVANSALPPTDSSANSARAGA